jgi:hypothetical protein
MIHRGTLIILFLSLSTWSQSPYGQEVDLSTMPLIDKAKLGYQGIVAKDLGGFSSVLVGATVFMLSYAYQQEYRDRKDVLVGGSILSASLFFGGIVTINIPTVRCNAAGRS